MNIKLNIDASNDELAKILADTKQKILEAGKTAKEVSTEIYNGINVQIYSLNMLNSKLGETEKAAEKLKEEASAIAKITAGTGKMTAAELRKIAGEAEALLKIITSKDWDDEIGKKHNITKDAFNGIKNNPEDTAKAIKQTWTEANKLETAFGKVGDGFSKLFSGPQKSKEGLDQIIGGLTEIGTAAKLVTGSISTLSDSFGNETLKDIGDTVSGAMDATTQGAKSGAALGPWGAAAGAALGLATSLTASFAKIHDKKHENTIKKLQNQIEILQESYTDLGTAIEKAYSNDAADLIEDQNVLLEQQKVLIQQQIEEERSKKKTDDNKIKAYEKQIRDIDKTILKNQETAINAIFGQDVKAAINAFADAYVKAWSAGEDKAKTSKDFVKNMIKQMIVEAMKSDISKPMEEIRKKLAEFWKDGFIDANEEAIIVGMADNLTNSLGKYDWADKYFKEDSKKTDTQESTKRGFETMSQETAGELNGRFTALQMSNEEIKGLTGAIQLDISEMKVMTLTANTTLLDLRDISLDSVFHLERINKNTSQLYLMNDKLDRVIDNTKNL